MRFTKGSVAAALIAAIAVPATAVQALAQPYGPPPPVVVGPPVAVAPGYGPPPPPPPGWGGGPHYYWRGHHWHHRAWAYDRFHRGYWRYY
ncbi:MAG: hypothetical protein INR65_05255 [Gluconacetobacter diazotrophicus]|nr:hypothetical protein [Gluconacetobacter diazotrophicus]